MKTYLINISLLIIMLTFQSFAQSNDKRYTHNLENGYMWQDFGKRMIIKNLKYEFLSSMLENQKVKSIATNNSDTLSCDNDIRNLKLKDSVNADLNDMIKMINKFYSEPNNLIIPIKYAYCYCIKELAGYSSDYLNNYRDKLLKFSQSNSEK